MRFRIFSFRRPEPSAPAVDKIAGVPVSELSPRGRAALSTLSAENVALKRSVEQLQTQLAEAHALADLDPLVPVFNRRAFERELTRTVSMSQRYGLPAAFVYIDLDGFKQINDSYGHAAGDAALLHVGTLLLAQVRESDIVGRLGGDEFGIILAQAKLADAHAKAEALMQVLRESSAHFEDVALNVQASYGVYEFGSDEKASGIIARADEAMYAHKALRKAEQKAALKN
ncbi:MAG: GGDEF domain-containing protein [Caulobacterales bacterium]